MGVRIIREALYTLATVLGGIFLIIAGATRFSPDAISPDLAAFINVTGPLLIGVIFGAGVMESALEAFGQPGNIRRR